MRFAALTIFVLGGCSRGNDCETRLQAALSHAWSRQVAAARAARDDVWAACQDEAKIKKLDAAIADAEKPIAPPPPREPTFAERLAGAESLARALSLVKPVMSDTANELSPGALALAVWGAQRLRWSELQGLPETKRALVMKDSESERGKRLCLSGSINQIEVDRSAGAAVYVGGLMTPGLDSVRFIAVGSTGSLVENSPARLCGVVTGKYSYSNTGGGTTHAVFVVGMFDLPENKK